MIISLGLILIQSIIYQQLIVIKNNKDMEALSVIENAYITKIKDDFYNYKTNDFEMDVSDCHISVKYKKKKAIITVTGKYQYVAYLKYNEEYATVDSYYYQD